MISLKVKYLSILMCCQIALFKIAVGQTPASIPNLELWLRSDSNISISNDTLIQWNDISGNNSIAYNLDNTGRPNFKSSIEFINNNPAIYFDGLNDKLFIDSPMEIQSAIVVFSGDVGISPFAGLITEQTGNSAQSNLFTLESSASLFNGPNFFGANEILTNGFYTLDVNPIEEFKYSIGTNSTARDFNNLVIGRNREFDSRHWKGHIAEIIIYSKELEISEIQLLQSYIIEKYNPNVDFSNTLFSEDFCEDTIIVQDAFSNYSWNTGENINEIIVSSSGEYILNTISHFGIEDEDTLQVLFPGNFIQDFNLCSGSDSIWDIGLGNTDFFYEWNDMSVNGNILIDSPGEYFVEVTDQNNCVFRSDTVDVVIDNFPSSASLGPDINLCSGNSLELVSGQNEAISYAWNDSSSNPELVVNTSGTYWVEAENANGCIARDTIDVTIIGQAPTASFVASNFCFGEEVNFTDLSFPPNGESITNWTWNFGDGDDSNDQNPVHTFDDLGTYPVSLTIQTPAGCTDIFETEIQINPLPVADFVVSNLCSDQDAFFDDNSSISAGTINNWSWEFGDNGSANGENVGHTYYEAGNYNVTLTATSDVGCSDTQTLNISINPSPVSSFMASSTCLGQATVFSQNIDTTIAGPAQIYAWDFDNGFTSNFPTTSQTYFVPGSYDVSLSVSSIFGCVDDTVQSVNINDTPNAGFSNLNACIGESTFFTDTTQIFLNDSIVEWHWNFSNQGASDIANPTFTFNNTGNFNVSLEVVSQAGCEASAQNIITVFEDPNPDFEFEPSIGLPPLAVTFENLTSDAINFIWNFGNGDSSVDFSPEYTYLDTGIFTIQLLAINENQCSDTLTKTILVIEPIFELDLSEIFCEINDDKIYASALVSNFGNHDINTFDISLNVGNGARITEVWNGLLRPGESFLYDFVAAPEFSPEVNQEFFCSTVSNPNGNNRELTLENNTVCKALSDEEFVLFPPYPNPNKGELNFNYILPIDNSVTLEIIDDLGRIVKYRELEGTRGHNSYQMFIPTLEVGSYLLRLSTPSSSQSQWFFVE